MIKAKRIWTSILFLIMMVICIPVTSLACEECYEPYEYVYVRTTGNVNFRAAPDINADIITTIAPGNYFDSTELVYTPDGRCWVGVVYCGNYGYISDRYLEYIYRYWVYPDECVLDPLNACSLQFEAARRVKAYSYIETNSKVVKTYRSGSILDIYLIFVNQEDDSLWGEVRFYANDNELVYAYVPLRHLVSVEPIPELSRYLKVTGGTVHVRSLPDIDSDVLGYAYRNNKLLADCFVPTFDGRIWASVYTYDYNWLGYVSMKYLKATR